MAVSNLVFSVWLLILVVTIVVLSIMYINEVYDDLAKQQQTTTSTTESFWNKRKVKQKMKYFPSTYAIFYPSDYEDGIKENMSNKPLPPTKKKKNLNMVKPKKQSKLTMQQKLNMMNAPLKPPS